jgi:hypothetical protein
MPAIRPMQLKTDVEKLCGKASDPMGFVYEIKELLDYYSDRTKRSGFRSAQPSLIKSYKVPKQVIQQILSRLKPEIISNPGIDFSLAELLWQENWLELKILALEILGWIPNQSAETTINVLKSWSDQITGDKVLHDAFAKGLVGLFKDHPSAVLNLLGSWVNSPVSNKHKLGIRVIPWLIKSRDFDNLPKIFSILHSQVVQVGKIPDADLLYSVRELSRYFPRETSYFLQRIISINDNPMIRGFIRQIIDEFPPDVKNEMTSFLSTT